MWSLDSINIAPFRDQTEQDYFLLTPYDGSGFSSLCSQTVSDLSSQSHINSSQQLNPSGYLTDWQTVNWSCLYNISIWTTQKAPVPFCRDLLHRDSMMPSIVACTAIGTDSAQNTVPLLLFMGHWLVMASCCDSTILALSQYATVQITILICSLKPVVVILELQQQESKDKYLVWKMYLSMVYKWSQMDISMYPINSFTDTTEIKWRRLPPKVVKEFQFSALFIHNNACLHRALNGLSMFPINNGTNIVKIWYERLLLKLVMQLKFLAKVSHSGLHMTINRFSSVFHKPFSRLSQNLIWETFTKHWTIAFFSNLTN